MRQRDADRIARQAERAKARLKRRGEFIHVDSSGTPRFASGRYVTRLTLAHLLESGAAVVIQKDLLGEPMQFGIKRPKPKRRRRSATKPKPRRARARAKTKRKGCRR